MHHCKSVFIIVIILSLILHLSLPRGLLFNQWEPSLIPERVEGVSKVFPRIKLEQLTLNAGYILVQLQTLTIF